MGVVYVAYLCASVLYFIRLKHTIMKRLFSLSVILVSIAFHGYAQMGLGIEAGANASNYTVKTPIGTKNTQFKWGMRLGVLSDMAISDNFYFQPGIYYVANHLHTDLSTGYEQYDLHTIEVPLNIQYKIGILGKNRLFVGLGPYVAFNRSGSYSIHVTYVDSKRALRLGNEASDDMQYFDFGGGVNVGYQITEGLFARVRAQMGFADLAPKDIPNASVKSLGICVSAGYLFYRRDKEGKLRIVRDRSNKKTVKE